MSETTTDRPTLGQMADLIAEHTAKYGDLGGVSLRAYPPETYGRIAGLLKTAIQGKEPITDAAVREALGWEPLPEGVLI